jgi:hypothetical protein
MAADGMQAFFDDLQVDPAGVLSLAIAWRLDCKQMGVITRAEFVKAYSTAGCVRAHTFHLLMRMETESVSFDLNPSSKLYRFKSLFY